MDDPNEFQSAVIKIGNSFLKGSVVSPTSNCFPAVLFPTKVVREYQQPYSGSQEQARVEECAKGLQQSHSNKFSEYLI